MAKDYAHLVREKEKWSARKNELEEELEKIVSEEKHLKEERTRIVEQVNYYTRLISDMKKELQPGGVSTLIRNI